MFVHVHLLTSLVRCECSLRWSIAIWMARKGHPLRRRALEMMAAGLATPGEIARVGAVSVQLVRNWRLRAKINTEARRDVHVRRLLLRGNGHAE